MNQLVAFGVDEQTQQDCPAAGGEWFVHQHDEQRGAAPATLRPAQITTTTARQVVFFFVRTTIILNKSIVHNRYGVLQIGSGLLQLFE